MLLYSWASSSKGYPLYSRGGSFCNCFYSTFPLVQLCNCLPIQLLDNRHSVITQYLVFFCRQHQDVLFCWRQQNYKIKSLKYLSKGIVLPTMAKCSCTSMLLLWYASIALSILVLVQLNILCYTIHALLIRVVLT